MVQTPHSSRSIVADGIPVYCAYDAIVPVEKCVPNPRNPNRHPAKQVDLLAKVIKAQGWRAPITVSTRSGFVVRGHGRLLAAQKLGVAEVPVDYQDYASEAEEWADLIADNRIAELAEVDNSALKDLLQELDTGEIDMELTGFTEKDLEDLMTQFHVEPEVTEDEVPEPPEEPVTKPGDLWLLGRHRLLCGDSTVITDVERLMNGRKAALVFTDPPYGVDYDGGTKRRDRLAGDRKGTSIYADVMPMLALASDQKAPWYIWHVHLMSMPVLEAITNAGYEMQAQIIWNKNQAQFGALSAHYKQKHEPCFYAHRKGVAPYWYGPTNEVTVWDVDRAPKNEFHPTQKPVELAARAIRNSSRPGDIVLDLFGGSGSTLVAAEQLGRACFMMEIEPKYCDVIIERWQNLTGQKAVREDGTPYEADD